MNAAFPTPSAEHLLSRVLQSHRHFSRSSPERWLRALENAFEEQISIYGRLLLPGLGLGERVEIDECHYQLNDKIWRQPPGELWHFDGCYPQNWIQAALLHPFEMLNNWLVLVPRAALTEAQARALSPPLIPRIKQALLSLDWIVADFGGHSGGRLRREDFLAILGDLPWIRIEHYADLQVIQIQRWQGDQLMNRWRASIYDTFGCTLPEIEPHTLQLQPCPHALHPLPEHLRFEPHTNPLQVAALLDILGDPYATLRRFTQLHYGIDIEKLGPLLLWRDFPDELFEFDDAQDTATADISFSIADSLDLHHQDVRPILHAWFEALANTPLIELPVIGTLQAIQIPELSPDAQLQAPSKKLQKSSARPLIQPMPSGQIYVASTFAPSYWMQKLPGKPH